MPVPCLTHTDSRFKLDAVGSVLVDLHDSIHTIKRDAKYIKYNADKNVWRVHRRCRDALADPVCGSYSTMFSAVFKALS